MNNHILKVIMRWQSIFARCHNFDAGSHLLQHHREAQHKRTGRITISAGNVMRNKENPHVMRAVSVGRGRRRRIIDVHPLLHRVVELAPNFT